MKLFIVSKSTINTNNWPYNEYLYIENTGVDSHYSSQGWGLNHEGVLVGMRFSARDMTLMEFFEI